MLISVIIPTLNNASLHALLEGLHNQTRPPDEIVVVGRDELGVLAGFPQVRFIDSGQPVCAAAARNLGMSHAHGDVFLFTDSDCIPHREWVAQHVLHQQDGLPVVGGGIEIKHPNYWVQSDNISMFHEFLASGERGSRFLLPTLNLSVRREVWEQVGGMDESFPGAAGEDSDWTIRIRRAGWLLHFEPSAVVRHAPWRGDWSSLVRHWRHSGYNNIRVRLRYATEFGMPWWSKQAISLRILSPFIAALITGRIYRKRVAWPYGLSLPIVYLTKIIYCWGAAKALEDGSAFQ